MSASDAAERAAPQSSPETPAVLIADDEPDVRRLLRMVMRSGGIEVIAEAVDGDQALVAYRDVQPVLTHTPSVVILDQRMPGRSGLEVAREILDIDPGQPVILLPAAIDDELRSQARHLGVARVVSKRDTTALAGIVRGLVERTSDPDRQSDGPAEAGGEPTPRSTRRFRWRG